VTLQSACIWSRGIISLSHLSLSFFSNCCLVVLFYLPFSLLYCSPTVLLQKATSQIGRNARRNFLILDTTQSMTLKNYCLSHCEGVSVCGITGQAVSPSLYIVVILPRHQCDCHGHYHYCHYCHVTVYSLYTTRQILMIDDICLKSSQGNKYLSFKLLIK